MQSRLMNATELLSAFTLIMEEPSTPPAVALQAVAEGARPRPQLSPTELLRLAALGHRVENT